MHHIYLYTHPPKTARTCEVNVDTFCERLETKNETLMQIVELNLVLGSSATLQQAERHTKTTKKGT